MSIFILDKKRPLPLPSHMERVIELRVNEVLFKIMGHYLFPVSYDYKIYQYSFFLKYGLKNIVYINDLRE